MNALVPERLTQARELAGLNKSDIARDIDVSVAAITQWENGTKNPTMENLNSFCRATGVRLEMLMRPISQETRAKGPLSFRAHQASKTNRLRAQAQRFADLCAEVFIWLEDLVSLPSGDLPELSSPGKDIEADARECRRHWGLGDRSISKLGELLESKGIRLCSTEIEDVRIDGFSCLIGGRPLIYLGSYTGDRARARFSCAHELGHLVLHHHHSDSELLEMGDKAEAEANNFASAFLLPADTFSADVADTSLNGFIRLKTKWGVSVQAMVRRARDLKLITQDTYERHYRTIGAKGWRRAKGEPFDDAVPLLNRTVGSKCLSLLEGSENFQTSQIEDALPFPESVFQSVFGRSIKGEAEAADNIIHLTEFGKRPERRMN